METELKEVATNVPIPEVPKLSKEELELLTKKSWFKSIKDAFTNFLDKAGDYFVAIGEKDKEAANILKRPLKYVSRSIGSFLKNPSESKIASILGSLKRLQYNIYKLAAVRKGKIAALLIGFAVLVGSLITIIKLNTHYHIFEKAKSSVNPYVKRFREKIWGVSPTSSEEEEFASANTQEDIASAITQATQPAENENNI